MIWRGWPRTSGRVLQVGHLERFSAAHGAVAGRMGRPLYIEATRIAPFKPRGTDVSVILDLMIHDLDLILCLVESPLESVDAVGAAVASPHEDIANARVRFENGSVATITASRISFRTERRMRVFAQDGYLAVDFASRELTGIARGQGKPIAQMPEFGVEDASWEDHDALAAEHAAFYASVIDGAPVTVERRRGTTRAGRRARGHASDGGIARAGEGVRADQRRGGGGIASSLREALARLEAYQHLCGSSAAHRDLPLLPPAVSTPRPPAFQPESSTSIRPLSHGVVPENRTGV